MRRLRGGLRACKKRKWRSGVENARVCRRGGGGEGGGKGGKRVWSETHKDGIGGKIWK